MTTRTILLTLAASVAPLYAQQPVAPVPAAELFTALAAPAAPATVATVDQRARVFSALALLPQNISDLAVLTNVGGNLLRLAESGKLPELDAGDLPAELLALDNIALATTPATPATYALLQHALVGLGTVGSSVQLAQEWATDARDELGDTIIEGLLLHADAASTLPEGTAEDSRIPASYLILTCKPGEEVMLQECAALLLADLREGGKPGVTAVDDANGFSGIRIDITETYKPQLEEATKDMAPRRKAQLLEQLAKHPVCLLTRLQGNALIIALCEDAQELHLTDTPADSVLATNLLAACDANLDKGMIAALHVSPELTAMGHAINSQPSLNLAGGVAAVFSKLAETDSANKAAYEQAAAAVSFMGTEMQKLIRPVTRPAFMQMWCDGDLHLSLTGDAQGCGYRPGRLRLAAMANAPATTLYTETTPVELGLTPPDSQALIEAAFSLAEGFSLTMKGDDRAQTEAAITTAKAFMPELRQLATACSTIGSGLDGHVALALDSTLAPLPAIAGIQPGRDAEAPRFAIFAGVSDRSQLAVGWDELRAAAGQVAAKLGATPEIINLLPISSRQVGQAMSYSISLPFFTQDAVPSVAVTDTGVAFGSSTNLTTQMVNDATGTTPFTGAAFALKFAPLAKTLRSIATSLDPAPEEAEPAATSKVRLEQEKGAPATHANATGAPACFMPCGESGESAAEQLSTAAAIAEYASTIAEGMYGTDTIEDGNRAMHIQIKMKD